MGNRHAVKLRRADFDYFRHMTTFSDKEIRTYQSTLIVSFHRFMSI